MIKYKCKLKKRKNMFLIRKQSIKNLIKISTLSLMFILGFFIINTFANSGENIKIKTFPNNNANYKNIIINPIANVAVAITTNIWLKLNKAKTITQSNINNKVFSVNDFYLNSDNIKSELIKNNMIFTKEYLNIIRMDFNSVIKKSNNREKTLFNIVKQLKIRLSNANSNIHNLIKQKSILISEYEKINTKIQTLKRNLEKDFNENNSEKVFKHVDNYYNLKEKEVILKTNIIFINNFIRKYNILNKYNSELTQILILNKDIISKNSYIVIPKSGTKTLKDFNLIFNEEEYKNKKQ